MKLAVMSGTILVGALLIAASILYIERWDIASIAYVNQGVSADGTTQNTDIEVVYRLDRWNGKIARIQLARMQKQQH